MAVSVRLEEEDKKKIEDYAKEHDLSMSQVIRKALREFFEKREE